MRKVLDILRMLRYERVDTARAIVYAYVMRPAAYALPDVVTRLLAQLGAAMLVVLDGFGRTARQYRVTFGRTGWGAFGLQWHQQANRLYEHAWLHRILAGRDRPEHYRVCIEGTAEALQAFNDEGSLVVASGHFLRGPATIACSTPSIARRPAFIVVAEPPSKPRNMHEWRIQVQLSLALRSMSAWSPKSWLQPVFRGRALLRVLGEMRAHARILYVTVDAHWPKSVGETVTVPFAGFAARTFSTGASRAARLVGCPLVLMIPMPPRGRNLTTRILGPYTSRAEGELERDADIMRQVLYDLERAVGECPEHYALEVGRDRVWCAQSGLWKSG